MNYLKDKILAMSKLFQDARHFQLLYLGSFLVLGIILLGWFENISMFLVFISTALITQALGSYLTKAPQNSWKSALITSLGLCLLCKTNDYSIAAMAAIIAIGSKFLIRSNGKHIYNPVNIGIILPILLFNKSWISPGQWGSHLMILFALGILGFLVIKKVDRIDASFTFLLVFGGLQLFRSVFYLGWSMDVFFHQIGSGTLVLFTFFMITDPMTTPNHRGARILWVSLIAIFSFVLGNYFYVYAAPIWVLFFAAPLTPIFDRIWSAQKFEWKLSQSILPIYKN